jgi:hypothetical protein
MIDERDQKRIKSNRDPNPRVRDLPHPCRTGSTLVLDVGIREEEAGPSGHRLTTTTARGSAPTHG